MAKKSVIVFLIIAYLALELKAAGTCDYSKPYVLLEDCQKTCTCPDSRCGVNQKLLSKLQSYICQKNSDLDNNEGDCNYQGFFDSEVNCKKSCFCRFGYCVSSTIPNPDRKNYYKPRTYYYCTSRCGTTQAGPTLRDCENVCKCFSNTKCANTPENGADNYKCIHCRFVVQRFNTGDLKKDEANCKEKCNCGTCIIDKANSPQRGDYEYYKCN